VKTVTEVTSTVITVDEACTNEATTAAVTCTRGGIASGATVYADYKYTPVATHKYTAGGKTSKSALMVRMTNYDIDDQEWVMLIHKAYIGGWVVYGLPSRRRQESCSVSYHAYRQDRLD